MEKILLMPGYSIFSDLSDIIAKRNPGITVTPNFEQVYAQVKLGEIDRVCIILCTATESPLSATNKIHAINPNIPILVWNTTERPEVDTENEIFLDMSDFTTEVCFDLIEDFFNGTLSLFQVSESKSR